MGAVDTCINGAILVKYEFRRRTKKSKAIPALCVFIAKSTINIGRKAKIAVFKGLDRTTHQNKSTRTTPTAKLNIKRLEPAPIILSRDWNISHNGCSKEYADKFV